MKVLQVHTRYRQTGGEDVAVATEGALLREAGHEVVTHTAANPETATASLAALAAAPWNPAAARRVAAVVREVRPDVVHVHNTWFALSPAVLPAIRGTGAPVVVTLHNYRVVCAAATLFRDGAPCELCVGDHPWHGVEHRCYRGSRAQSAVAAGTIALQARRGTWDRDVDRFLTLTEFGRQRFIAGGLPADRLTVKSNSVADPGPRQRPPSASNEVVFVGRLSEEKGVGPLLEAWRDAPPSLELVVVGSGPLEDQLRRAAPDRVRFTGPLPAEEVTAMMLRARALAFPSIWYEGQGLVALEAAAAGLPVLLSDLGAMAGLFAPGAEELTLPPGDVAGTAAVLGRLADDRFVDGHGRAVRRRFEERYTHAVARERLETVYREVVAARNR